MSESSAKEAARNVKEILVNWIPAYQGNDGRVVDENLWFRLLPGWVPSIALDPGFYAGMTGSLNLGLISNSE
uniref:Uncharacterized protein n=1 Tax=Candidatus Kentrum sp. UNK TaxID=2126344 RepID=A0A451B4A6_9GAMM|nr:MAG: hypothetical protein BECKUNK1418G_GA0071005_11661 [Candidatus Kentron sp. UNK]VFK73122.1 MAG: hypothetical protein BECKUNK1418H_GA0071006_11651 [Candidatus Kentron sp. UNK]